MSRYTIPTEADHLELVVGYDPPLGTFFAQVFDSSVPDDADDCIVWVGDDAAHPITSVADLQAQLEYPIPADIQEALRQDAAIPHVRSPLQAWAHRILTETRESTP